MESHSSWLIILNIEGVIDDSALIIPVGRYRSSWVKFSPFFNYQPK